MFQIKVTIPLPHDEFENTFQTICITENQVNRIVEYYISKINDIELCRTYSTDNVISMHYFVLSRIVSYINKNPFEEINYNVLKPISFSNKLNIWIEEY